MTGASKRAKEQESREAQLEAVANGVIWLGNNIHQYGTDAWRGYFEAVLRDALALKESAQ